jgi:hypothetical protein
MATDGLKHVLAPSVMEMMADGFLTHLLVRAGRDADGEYRRVGTIPTARMTKQARIMNDVINAIYSLTE